MFIMSEQAPFCTERDAQNALKTLKGQPKILKIKFMNWLVTNTP